MASQKKCVGVDFGAKSVKVAELALTKNGLRVLNVGSAEFNIPPDAPPADRHKIQANTLRALLKSLKISTREAVFCMPGQTVFVRRFPLPKTSPERLEKIIRYEARQQIPFPVDKTLLEYQVFDTVDRPEVDVFLVALKKDALFEFMNLVDRSGLKPVGISVSTLAMFNYHSLDNLPADKYGAMFEIARKKKSGGFKLKLKIPKIGKKGKSAAENKSKAPEQESEEAPEESWSPEVVKAYINMGATVTDISIGSAGPNPVLGFTRSILMGGVTMNRTIMENCEVVESLNDAERIRREEAVILSMDADYQEGTVQQASEAATAVLDRIIAEVRRSLDFYISQPDGMAVDEIVLSGGLARMTNLAAYIEEKLGITVSVYNQAVSENLQDIKSAGDDLALYPVALGLAVLGLGKAPLMIDFLPPERKVTIKFKKKKVFVFILAAMVGSITLLGAMSGGRYIQVYETQASQYQDEYMRHLPMIKRIQSAKDEHEELKKNYERLAKGLTDQRDFPLQRWLDILKAKPSDVLVSSLQILPNGTIIIEGFTEDMGSAVAFTSNLNRDLKDDKKVLEADGARMPNITPKIYNDLFKKDVTKFTINLKFKDRYSRVIEEKRTAQPQPGSQGGGQRGGRPQPGGRPNLPRAEDIGLDIGEL